MLRNLFHQWRNSYLGIPRSIWMLSLVSFINRCGAMVIAFMTVYMTQHLQFSIQETGYVMGFFGVGALAGAFAGGKLTDRLGYYNMQLLSLVLSGLMLIFLMAVTGFWAMAWSVLVFSFVSEIFRPANSVAIARHSTPETRTRSISLYRMSVNLGWTLAPALGGLLAALGWHWLFWVDGLTCILAAVLLRVLLPPVKGGARATDALATLTKADSPYRDRHFLVFSVLTVLNATIFMQLLWTIPVFFKEVYQWSESLIGLVAALNGLVVFLVEMPLVYRIDGKRTNMHFIRMGLGLYAAAYFVLLLSPQYALVLALIYMSVMSLGEILVMPFSTNYVFGRAKAPGSQGQYMAIYTMSYSLSTIIAPILGTQTIAAWGYNALWVLIGGLSGAAILGFWWLEREMEKPAPVLETDSGESSFYARAEEPGAIPG